jgi:hypothetical protein
MLSVTTGSSSLHHEIALRRPTVRSRLAPFTRRSQEASFPPASTPSTLFCWAPATASSWRRCRLARCWLAFSGCVSARSRPSVRTSTLSRSPPPPGSSSRRTQAGQRPTTTLEPYSVLGIMSHVQRSNAPRSLLGDGRTTCRHGFALPMGHGGTSDINDAIVNFV